MKFKEFIIFAVCLLTFGIAGCGNNVTSSQVPTTSTSPEYKKQEFEKFYSDFKKQHDAMRIVLYERIGQGLQDASKGKIRPTDFYSMLKQFDENLLVVWNYWDKRPAPPGLNSEQHKIVKQSIEYMALSALTTREAVQGLRDGMNNPNDMEASQKFDDNIKKALLAHKKAGEDIEKIKQEIDKEK